MRHDDMGGVGIHAAARHAGAALTSDSLPRRAGAQREVAQSNRSRSRRACHRARTDHASAQGETPRMSWARLLKRVFDIDVEHCPNCGGALKIIAAIEDPPVIIKILSHLGLPTRAPARRVDLFQTI